MRFARLVPLAALLLAACAGTPEAAPPEAPAPAEVVRDGSFRMRIVRSYSNRSLDGTLDVVFDTVLETADGRPIPPNRWFFEGPRIAEDFFLDPGGRTWRSDSFAGAESGWSPKGYFAVREVPAGTRAIRRIVVDLPLVEVLDGKFEEIRLAKGAEAIRTIGGTSYEFEAPEDGGLGLFTYDATKPPRAPDEGEEQESEAESEPEPEDRLPMDGFYGVAHRPIERAWEITDARGRPFVQGPGMGCGVFTHDEYGRDPRVAGTTEYPLIVRWRVPTRWRATMQRFVFEDLVVPEPEPDPVEEPTPPPEEK